MKININTLEELLFQSLDQDKAKELVNKIAKVEQELIEEAKDSKAPKQKNQFVIVNFKDTETGLVVTIPEGEDTGTVLTRISNAAREYNQTKKGQKKPCQNLVDSASFVKRAFHKNNGIAIKTKYPVRIVESDNSLV